MRYLAVLVAALAAIASPVAAATSEPLSGVERLGALEHELLSELNRVRAARSLPTLRPAVGLRRAAAVHSRAMLETGFFDHTSPDGTSFDQRIRRHYSNRDWRSWSVGETLLATSEALDARLMVAEWLESRAHRAIILSPSWRDIGIAAQYEASAPGTFGGASTTVVTADFGVRAGKLSRSRR